MNAVEIEEAISELSQQPFEGAEFPFQLLASFGIKDATLKRLRKGDTNKSDCGGVLKRQDIHILVTEPGGALNGLDTLRDSKATVSQKCPLILSTDGQDVHIESLKDGVTHALDFENLADGFGALLPLAGISTVKEIRENAFDIKATGRLNRLYVALLNNNPDWAAADMRDELNHFMARLIFCFFAEDTSIFAGDDAFTKIIEQMTEGDGSNVHMILETLFEVMDVPFDQRNGKGLPNYCLKFPYVNGNLFSGNKATPKFDRQSRNYLLHIGRLDWTKINPDIFGSMIQAITDDDERSSLGQHYTSVPSILKVLNPLFLDELHEALEQAGDNARKLLNLKKRIARIRVFDPACGSGNFLVIAYKELRKIEAEINRRRKDPDTRTVIPLTNFRGIEIKGFSAEVARLALVIAEYQCDVEYRSQNEALEEFLPLATDNWITHGNALELEWEEVCPPYGAAPVESAEMTDTLMVAEPSSTISFENDGGEIFICGNPPFKGSRKQTAEEKEDLRRVFEPHTKKWKNVDYVGAWLVKAAIYNLTGYAPFAFVSTNSICQGQQVDITWALLLRLGLKIRFAHLPFKWSNLASRKAGVTVVVIGLDSNLGGKRRLIHEERVSEVTNINPYLTTHSVESIPACNKPKFVPCSMLYGVYYSKSAGLILDAEARRTAALRGVPDKFIKRFIGSTEFINGVTRYCLWISDDEREEAASNSFINERLESVRLERLATGDKSVKKLAARPHQFRERKGEEAAKIFVPIVSSEDREYLPAGVVDTTTVPTNKAFFIPSGPLWALSIIVSRLHLKWIETVCGRLEMRFSYSNTLGWNTFPVPKLTQQNRDDLTRTAENILLAREAHYPKTIADLYKPDEMPANLRAAHKENDEVLERIYIGRRFKNDTERLEKLFQMYEKAVARDKA